MPIRTRPTLNEVLAAGNSANKRAILDAKRLEGFLQAFIFEDFIIGDTLPTGWDSESAGGSPTFKQITTVGVPGGMFEIATGTVIGAGGSVTMGKGSFVYFVTSKNPIIELAINFQQVIEEEVTLGLVATQKNPAGYFTATDVAAIFTYDPDGSAVSFKVRTADGTTGSNDDTEFTPEADTLYIFRLELSSAGVTWTIMDSARVVQKTGTKTSDWPPPANLDGMYPYAGIETKEGVTKQLWIDYVYAVEDRQ